MHDQDQDTTATDQLSDSDLDVVCSGKAMKWEGLRVAK